MATFSNDDTFLERTTPTRVLFSNVSFVAIRFLFVKLCEIELKNVCVFFVKQLSSLEDKASVWGCWFFVLCKTSRRREISNSFKHPLMNMDIYMDNMVNLYLSVFVKQSVEFTMNSKVMGVILWTLNKGIPRIGRSLEPDGRPCFNVWLMNV